MNRNQWIALTGATLAALFVWGGYFYVGQRVQQPPVVAGATAPVAPDAAAAPATPPQTQSQSKAKPPSQPAETDVAALAPGGAEAPAIGKPLAPPAAAAPEAAPIPDKEILPSFDMVRVEKTGEAVIAGRAAPGAQVAVKYNGETVGTATANAEGDFAIVPEKPLARGSGMLTLEMTKDGKVTQSEASVMVAVKEGTPALVAKVNPQVPTDVTQVPAPAEGPPPDVVQLNVVDYDAAGNIVFSGRARPGATIRFYVDNAIAGETRADEAGRWQFKGGMAVAPGEHVLRADELDAKGKVVSRIELPFVREREDVVAAAQVPQAAAPAAAASDRPGTKMMPQPAIVPERIIIQPGHNLWRLSRQIYGKGRLYTVIYEANRDQLRNPNRVYPGQILTAPIAKAN
jgi:nucleoid-associated protein YgaU